MKVISLNIQRFKVNCYNENKVVLAEDSKLQIQITLPNENGTFIYCYTLNNERHSQEIKSGDIVEIQSPTFGNLTSYVTQAVNGSVVARYEIEPLIITSGGLDGQPVIIARPELSIVKEEIKNDYTDKIKECTTDYTNRIATLQKQIDKLIDAVSTIYSNDLNVEETTAENFLKEIEKIKGEAK